MALVVIRTGFEETHAKCPRTATFTVKSGLLIRWKAISTRMDLAYMGHGGYKILTLCKKFATILLLQVFRKFMTMRRHYQVAISQSLGRNSCSCRALETSGLALAIAL